MWMKEMFVFFLSLALGYILCVIAKKQTSLLKTVGWTLGIGILVLTFLVTLISAQGGIYKGKGCPACGVGGAMHGMPMMKHCR